MRALRMAVAGTATLALISGLGGAVLAQDPELATWTHVTGQTNMDDEWVETEVGAGSSWAGSVEYMDSGGYIMPVEWSDPRLPETMHVREQVALHHGDVESWDDSMWVFARALRLEAPEGAWAGSAHGVAGSDGTLMLYELTGEGAYEGLSALLGQDNSQWPISQFDGWIFEGDIPPLPEPVEPTAE